MYKITMLFINYKFQKYSVYEFGHAIGNVLIHSKNLIFFIGKQIVGKNSTKYFRRKSHRLLYIITIQIRWSGSEEITE